MKRFINFAWLGFFVLPCGASADPVRFEILPGASVTFEAEAALDLTGAFELECRPDPPSELPCAFRTGDVIFDVTAFELAAGELILLGQGPFEPVSTSQGVGFELGRQLILEDVGILSLPPPVRAARIAYGFPAELVASFPSFDRFQFWYVSDVEGSVSTWSGSDPLPEMLVLDARLTENLWDLAPTSFEAQTVERSAVISLTALRVPEPSILLLQAAAVGALAGLRAGHRVRSRGGSRATRSFRPEDRLD